MFAFQLKNGDTRQFPWEELKEFLEQNRDRIQVRQHHKNGKMTYFKVGIANN